MNLKRTGTSIKWTAVALWLIMASTGGKSGVVYASSNRFHTVKEWFKNLGNWPSKKTIRSLVTREPEVTFDNIVGNQVQKNLIRPLINHLSPHPTVQKSSLNYNNVVLLEGTGRSGKSFFADAVAGELKQRNQNNFLYYSICAAILNNKNQIKKLFNYIRWLSTKKVVVLVIEDLYNNEFLQKNHDPNNDILCALIRELKRIKQSFECKIIIFVCNNTFNNSLAPALLESEIFDFHMCFDYPMPKERKKFLKQALHNTLIDNECIEIIGNLTTGYSFDRLAHLLSEALQHAKQQNRNVLKEDIIMAYHRNS